MLHTCLLEVFIFCFILTLDYCFQCFDDTEKLQWEHIGSEWKQEKQKALNALAGTSEEFLNLSLQPEVKREFFMYRTPFLVISNQSITYFCTINGTLIQLHVYVCFSSPVLTSRKLQRIPASSFCILCQLCWYRVVSPWPTEFLHIIPLAEIPPTFCIFLELLYHVHDLGLLAECEKNNHMQSDI